jgi:hypothetical protein
MKIARLNQPCEANENPPVDLVSRVSFSAMFSVGSCDLVVEKKEPQNNTE